MWVNLIQSAEGLKKKRWRSLKEKEFFLQIALSLSTATSTPVGIPSLRSAQQISNLFVTITMQAIFFKISPYSLSLSFSPLKKKAHGLI